MNPRTGLLLLALVLLACHESATDAPPASAPVPELPRTSGSVLFGDAPFPEEGACADGGRLEIGFVVPSVPEVPLVDRLPIGAEEADRLFPPGPPSAEVVEDPPALDEEPVVLEEDEEWVNLLAPDWTIAVEVSRRLGVTVEIHEILADEAERFPLVVHQPALPEYEAAAIREAAAGGTLVSERLSHLLTAAALEPLARKALRESSRVRRLSVDPLRVLEAKREGDDVVVRFAGRPTSAALVDFDGKTHWSDESVGRETVRFVFPAGERNAFAHVLIVRWRGDGLDLRRSYPVERLVGEIRSVASVSSVADAGGPLAVPIRVTNTLTGEPVPGYRETIAIRYRDELVAETEATTGHDGRAVASLDVPEDAAPGVAWLRIGPAGSKRAQDILVNVRRQLRVSIVTDRGIYRPGDDIHVRAMVQFYPSGRPAPEEDVTLFFEGDQKRIETSEHGIASAVMRAEGRRLGSNTISASVSSGARAKTNFVIRSFEKPRMLLSCSPPGRWGGWDPRTRWSFGRCVRTGRPSSELTSGSSRARGSRS